MFRVCVRLMLVFGATVAVSFAGSPQALAETYKWDELRNGVTVSLGEKVTILVCWHSAAKATLYRDDTTPRRLVDAVKGVRNTRVCGRKNPYLQRHVWTVDTLPEPSADGRRLASFGLGPNGTYNWTTWVEVSTPAESPTPTPAPSVIATPTPTPAPAPASTAPQARFNEAFASALWNAARRSPDRAYGRCVTLADPRFDADSREFYKLGAWTGEQLYKLSYADSLTTVWFAYEVYCSETYGIKTRFL